MGKLISLVILYLLLAAIAGWWPFGDSALQTLSGRCTYDAGYEDGWTGELPACESTEYLAGYEGGVWESDCHFAKCVKRDRNLFKKYRCGSWRDHTC